jgi:hypothetical protein
MAADTLKSLSITNLDTLPVLENSAGVGAPSPAKIINDYVTPTVAGLASTASLYRVLRVPMNCRLKGLQLIADSALDSSTGLVLNVGAYYSDSTVDGTPLALQGTLISANCFSSANAGFKSSAVGPVDALGAFGAVKRNQPLWLALGLASNPGGFIDIVVAVSVVATTAASAPLTVQATHTI